MSAFTPQAAADFLAACQAGAAEASAALSRTLGQALTVRPVDTTTWSAVSGEAACPGLALALDIGAGGVAVILAESTGLVPAWCAAPDATGKSKLATLAQELGMLLVPESFMPVDFQVQRVGSLVAALQQAGVSSDSGVVRLEIMAGEKQAFFHVIWPLPRIKEMLAAPAPIDPPATVAVPAASAGAPSGPRFKTLDQGLPKLPPYGRSLLQITLPVTVTLATTKQPVQRIVELGPGSIIQFNKLCTEPLELEIGNQRVALGECVKVGDKFGLRITSMVLPEERFVSLRRREAG